MRSANKQRRGNDNARVEGFTLIELLIVIVIIAIILAIAYPSYHVYVNKSRRTDAFDLLQQLSHREEKFMTFCNTYTNKLNGTLSDPNDATLNCSGLGLSDNNTLNSKLSFYQITEGDIAVTATGLSYTISVSPTSDSAQNNDSDCQVLSLSSVGDRSSTNHEGTSSTDICWP